MFNDKSSSNNKVNICLTQSNENKLINLENMLSEAQKTLQNNKIK